jgi:F420H(2)-dependent quinone reductase
MKALTAVGIYLSLMTDIETTGRKTGLMRQVQVAAAFDDTGAWPISQHGTRSGWGANIAANPRSGSAKAARRTATGVMVHDDDVIARALAFSNNHCSGRHRRNVPSSAGDSDLRSRDPSPTPKTDCSRLLSPPLGGEFNPCLSTSASPNRSS